MIEEKSKRFLLPLYTNFQIDQNGFATNFFHPTFLPLLSPKPFQDPESQFFGAPLLETGLPLRTARVIRPQQQQLVV